MQLLGILSATLACSIIVTAHPGHDINQEIRERAKALEHSKRDISHCAAKMKARGVQQRTINRRLETLRSEREKRLLPIEQNFIKARGLAVRDWTTVLATNHTSPIVYNPDTPLDTLFAGNQSCILVPEVTEGPYYVSGELIRSDIRETEIQKGVDLVLDVQVIDVTTCEPVPDLMLDFWHCNATGIYSGVLAGGNNGGPENINATFLRGLQQTDSDGVAVFTTFYPGHYTGRTQHIHVATHAGGAVLPNNTFSGANVSHVGQVFFDQDLSTLVEATAIYAANTQPVTTNAGDGIFIQEAAQGDPVIEYSLFGETVEDGILAWIAFGIEVSKSSAIHAAAFYGSDGGHVLAGGGGGPPGPPGGGPPPPPNSTSAVGT